MIGQVVRVMVLAPAVRAARMVVAPRTILEGVVEDAGIETVEGRRHFVQLRFTAMRLADGAVVPVDARVAEVDDARETVDAEGRIFGPRELSIVRDRADWAALAIGTANPVAGAVFFASLRTESHERHRKLNFPAGTDLTLRLAGAVPLPSWPTFANPPRVDGDSMLGRLLATLPRQAVAAGGRVLGDFVNLVFIGDEVGVRGAFENAGWSTPERMSTRADFETFIAAARGAGYTHQPVSRQVVFGRPPDLVFQRVADTFAKRHHVRLWRTSARWEGAPVWIAAATHDIGVEFSEARRSFTHRTDEAIDGERSKIVNDFVATRQVAQLSSVARMPPPDAVARGAVRSDWRVAVIRVR